MMDLEAGEGRDGIACQIEIGGVVFDSDTAIADCFACGEGGTGAGETIEENSISKREHCTGELAEKLLWFEAWMVGDGAFVFVGWG